MRHAGIDDALLLRHADGELSAAETAAVREHLETCWVCRARLSAIEQDLHRLARLSTHGGYLAPERKRAAWEAILSRIEAEPGIAQARRRWWRPAVLTPASAAIAFAAGAMWVASHREPPPAKAPAPVVLAPPARAPAANPAPVPTPVRTPEVTPQPAEIGGLPEAPRPNPLAEAIEAYRAVHAMGACFREGVSVELPEHGPVTVRGVLGSSARREALASALAARVPNGLRLELRAMDEPVEAPGEEIRPAVEVDAPVQGGLRIPLYGLVARSLAGAGTPAAPLEGRVLEYAETAMRLSETVNREVQALDRLAATFRENREAELDEEPRGRLAVLVMDHFRRLEAESAALRVHLAAAFGEPSGGRRQVVGTWQGAARQWREDYPHLHQTLLRAFSIETEAGGEEAAARVRAGLRSLESYSWWEPQFSSR